MLTKESLVTKNKRLCVLFAVLNNDWWKVSSKICQRRSWRLICTDIKQPLNLKTSFHAIDFHYRKLGTDGSSLLLTCSGKERRAQSPYWAFDMRVKSFTILHQILLQPLSFSQREWIRLVFFDLSKWKHFDQNFFLVFCIDMQKDRFFSPVWTCGSFYLFILMSYISVICCCLKYFMLFMWSYTYFVIWKFSISRMRFLLLQ